MEVNALFSMSLNNVAVKPQNLLLLPLHTQTTGIAKPFIIHICKIRFQSHEHVNISEIILIPEIEIVFHVNGPG